MLKMLITGFTPVSEIMGSGGVDKELSLKQHGSIRGQIITCDTSMKTTLQAKLELSNVNLNTHNMLI
jgi:hypothetical protein